jgi:hypothetical protein
MFVLRWVSNVPPMAFTDHNGHFIVPYKLYNGNYSRGMVNNKQISAYHLIPEELHWYVEQPLNQLQDASIEAWELVLILNKKKIQIPELNELQRKANYYFDVFARTASCQFSKDHAPQLKIRRWEGDFLKQPDMYTYYFKTEPIKTGGQISGLYLYMKWRTLQDMEFKAKESEALVDRIYDLTKGICAKYNIDYKELLEICAQKARVHIDD